MGVFVMIEVDGVAAWNYGQQEERAKERKPSSKPEVGGESPASDAVKEDDAFELLAFYTEQYTHIQGRSGPNC
jgi:hypothetical protein